MFIFRPKPVKKPRVTQAKKTNPKNEKKKETPVFILPKQSSQIILPLQSQNVELQTELTGVQFMISKRNQPVCQGVQTSFQPLSDSVKSVSVQTASNFQESLPASFQCPSEKISMGIQTILLASPLPPVQSCVAEIQTNEYTGKSSIATSTVPILKINKCTQKSPFKKQKKQTVIKSSSSSQTNSSAVSKKSHLLENTALLPCSINTKIPMFHKTSGLQNINLLTSPNIERKKSEFELSETEFVPSMDEFEISMPTQTDFNCMLGQHLPESQQHYPSGLPKLHRIHDSHTQTSGHESFELVPHGSKNYDMQSKHTQFCKSKINQFQNKDIQAFRMDYQEQKTQTQPNNLSSAQSQTIQIDSHKNKNVQTLRLEYQEQNTQTQPHNLSSIQPPTTEIDRHFPSARQDQEEIFANLGRLNRSLISLEDEEKNIQQFIDPKSLLSKCRATQTQGRNLTTDVMRCGETQTSSFSYKPISSSASLTDQLGCALNNSLNFSQDMDEEVVNIEKMPVNRSTEPLSSILLEALNDSCQAYSQELDLDSFNENAYAISPRINFDHVMNRASDRYHQEKDAIFTQSKCKPIIGQNQSAAYGMEGMTSTDKFCGNGLLETINDFAWDTGTQTFDNLMWEMGTQTIEDLVMEMGTQTITDFSSSQMVDVRGLDIGTQTVANMKDWHSVEDLGLLMETQAMASGNWELTKQTVNGQALEMGTQTMTNMSLEIGNNYGEEMNQHAIDHILVPQTENFSGLEMRTQTVDKNTTSSLTVGMNCDDLNLKAETQKSTDTIVWRTGDDNNSEMGIQTMADVNWTKDSLTANDLGQEMGTQTMTVTSTQTANRMVLEMRNQTLEDMTALKTIDELGLDMGTQTVVNMTTEHSADNLGFGVESQTMSNGTRKTTPQTMGGLDLDMGLQTMTGITTLQTADNKGPQMGAQMKGILSNLQVGDCVGYEMGTQTIADKETLQVVDDLGLEIGTQTLEQYIRDSHTQTDLTRNWYDDVTQTEEDLLEFLTRETQTQTGDDLLEFLTRETQTQISHFGDERSVQTEENLLEFFTTATQTQVIEAFSTQASMNNIGVETEEDLLEFLTKETETQTQEIMDFSDISSS